MKRLHIFFIITLLITTLFPILLSFYGDLDTWETFGAYIGFIFLGMCFIALGLFISATTENQMIAAIVTFGALLLIWIMKFLKNTVPTDKTAGLIFALVLVNALATLIYFSIRRTAVAAALGASFNAGVLLTFLLIPEIYIGFIGKVLGWVSPVERYGEFALGILNFHTILYYISFSTFFLFLTGRVLDKKRWI